MNQAFTSTLRVASYFATMAILLTGLSATAHADEFTDKVAAKMAGTLTEYQTKKAVSGYTRATINALKAGKDQIVLPGIGKLYVKVVNGTKYVYCNFNHAFKLRVNTDVVDLGQQADTPNMMTATEFRQAVSDLTEFPYSVLDKLNIAIADVIAETSKDRYSVDIFAFGLMYGRYLPQRNYTYPDGKVVTLSAGVIPAFKAEVDLHYAARGQ